MFFRAACFCFCDDINNLLVHRPATAAGRAVVGGCGAVATASSDGVLRASEDWEGKPARTYGTFPVTSSG